MLASACFLNLFHVTLPSTQEGKGPEIEILSALSTFFSQVVLEADLQQTPYSSYAPSATSQWSSLIALNLTFQQVDTQMMTNFLHTGVNQLQILVFNCVQLDAAVILQLTQSECRRLRSLALSYNGLGSMAVSYLAQGKWPLLWKVSLEGNEDTVLDELFKGDWPLIEKLKLTVRSLRGKAITRWLGLSSNGVQEALNLPT